MTEVVIVRHSAEAEWDSDGNPVAAGDPVELQAIEVAPGNELITYGIGADLTDISYTVYFELGTQIADDDEIKVRGDECLAKVALWDSSGLGGLAVLARAKTGASSQ